MFIFSSGRSIKDTCRQSDVQSERGREGTALPQTNTNRIHELEDVL